MTLRLEAHRGWPPLERSAQQPQVLASGELLARLAKQEDEIPIFLEAGGAPQRQIIEQADHPYHRCRGDVPFAGLVVEADVAADDGQFKGAARVGEAPDAFLQLAEDQRPLP